MGGGSRARGATRSTPPQPSCCLEEVLFPVLRFCEHDAVFAVAAVSRSLREMVLSADHMWAEMIRRRGWDPATASEKSTVVPVAGCPMLRAYAAFYKEGCYDCGVACTRALNVGTLRIRLCKSCSSGYAAADSHQRLVSQTDAQQQYALKKSHLQGLPYAVIPSRHPLRRGSLPRVSFDEVLRAGPAER